MYSLVPGGTEKHVLRGYSSKYFKAACMDPSSNAQTVIALGCFLGLFQLYHPTPI